MRRATITLPDELERLVDEHLGRLAAPPSLTVLVQAALRLYLSEEVRHARAEVAEPPEGYDSAGGRKRLAEHAAGSVALDPEAELALRQAAARQGIEPDEIAREVLAEWARGRERPLPRGVGKYGSGRSDVSSRAEEILRGVARERR